MPIRTKKSLSRKSPYESIHVWNKTQWLGHDEPKILDAAQPVGVVNLENDPIASENTATGDVDVVHTGTNDLTSKKQKLCNPAKTGVVPEESLVLLSKVQVEFCAKQLLHECEERQQLYMTAVQHFDVHNQLFASACAGDGPDRVKDILATLREVQRASCEMFAPQESYVLTVSKYRLFLAELLPRLPVINLVRANITAGFNDLSRDYEQKENAVRETIGAIFMGEGGSLGENMGLYLQVFRARGEMLKAHQEVLEKWVKHTVAELPDGYMGFQKDSCIAQVADTYPIDEV